MITRMSTNTQQDTPTRPAVVGPVAGGRFRRLARQFTRRATPVAVVLAMVAGFSGRDAVAQQAGATGSLSSAALDSVAIAFASADWNERHAALVRLNSAYPDVLPGAVVPPVLALLRREAAAPRADHVGDEDFGEYVVDLVLTGVRTGDPAAVPSIVMLDGLSMSSGVAAFVAAQGRAVMPVLDSLAATREDRASDVVETYALMYARHGARLTHADSAQVLRRMFLAAAHPSPAVRAYFAHVAAKGVILELLPAVADMAASDSGRIQGVSVVRQDAGEALPALQRASDALTPGALLDRLTLLTDAACDDAQGELRGQCVALGAHVATAVRFVAAGQSGPAVVALGAYQRAVRRLAVDGLVPRLPAVALDGVAGAVVGRLSAGR